MTCNSYVRWFCRSWAKKWKNEKYTPQILWANTTRPKQEINTLWPSFSDETVVYSCRANKKSAIKLFRTEKGRGIGRKFAKHFCKINYQWNKRVSTPHCLNVCLRHYRLIGVVMTLTFDLWPWKPFQRCPLTWWIFMPRYRVTQDMCY